MKIKYLLISVWLLGVPLTMFGQGLTVDGVITKVLKNNFDVKVADLDNDIATNNATKGNAGLMPSVQLNTGGSYSNNNTELKFAGGIPNTNVKGAVNTNYNASLAASYTIFNGFANLKTYEKLQVVEEISDEQLRLTLENAIITTIGLFMDLQRLNQDKASLRHNLDLSSDRLRRLKKANELGVSTSLEYLNAKVDYNNDSVSLLNVVNQIGTIKRQLNVLMGQPIDSEWEPQEDPYLLPSLSLGEILIDAMRNNVNLVLADLRTKSSELDADIASANIMPKVVLTTGYGFSNSQNGAGIVLQQNTLGLNAGLNVTLPIYNGGKIKTAIANSMIQMDRNELVKKQSELVVEKEVRDHWANFVHYRNLEKLETENVAVATARLDRATESYKLGQITSLEYRDAQIGLLVAQNRLSAARFESRKEAYQLLRLQGKLLNNNS
ncbi:MAG: hypothetical protein GC181_01045 [Bacteroidetes bacterium]|nr:hypothetical protein [Bacteroidota bacterium]